MLVNENADPLIAEVLKTLQARLKPSIEVNTCSPGLENPWLPEGRRLPDLVIRVKLLARTRSDHTDWSTIWVSTGQGPWNSRHSYWGPDSLPLAQTFRTGWLDHKSTFEEPTLGDHLGAALAESLRKQIEEEQKRHSVLPLLPSSLEGPFHPAPLLLLPETASACRVLSGQGLFCHNETYWRLNAPPGAGLLEDLRARYEAAGWSAEASSESYLRLTRNRETVEFYPIWDEEVLPDLLAAPPSKFAAHYREDYDASERAAAAERLFAAGLPPESVYRFAGLSSEEARRVFFAKIRPGQCFVPEVWLEASKFQEPEAAWHSLKRAKALLITREKSDALSRAIIDAGVKLRRNLTLSAEDFRETGFEALPTEPGEIDRAEGKPVLVYWETGGAFYSALIEVQNGGQMLHIVFGEDGYVRGWSRGTFAKDSPFSADLRNQCPIRLSVSKQPGGYRYFIKPFTGPL